MSPNLMLPAKKVLTPWEYFQPNRNSSNIQQLYVANEPVPGIYCITPSKKRYLLSIKSNGKKDFECIFRATNAKFRSASLPIISATGSVQTTSSNSSGDRTPNSTTTLLGSTQCKTNTVSFAISNKKLQHGNLNIDPHRKAYSECLLSQLKFMFKPKKSRIQPIDINGYKPLSCPLRIKFSKTLNRWMFKSEIENRTTDSPICTHTDFVKGGCVPMKRVESKLMVLDDGFSWVVVRDVKHRSTKEWAVDMLYCVNDRTKFIRKQDFLEANLSNIALQEKENSHERPGFMINDEKADYMAVLRYLGLV